MRKNRIRIMLCFVAVFVATILFYHYKAHTFTLAEREGTIVKSEQIQPLWNTVKVSSDCDTEVSVTDIQTGEIYKMGYLTSGVSEKIRLKKGRWYAIQGAGNLIVAPVNVRIE